MSKWECKYCGLEILKQPCGCPGEDRIKAMRVALEARGMKPAVELDMAGWVALGRYLREVLR